MFDRFLKPIREFGLLTGLAYLVGRTAARVSPRLRIHLYDFMVQPIVDKPLLPDRFRRNLEMREIGPGHPDLETFPVGAEVTTARYQQGATCLGLYRAGELLGYIWLCFGRYDEDEVRCTYMLSPVEQSVFDFDLYIFPQHRFGVAFPALWDGTNQFLRERGIRYTFSRVSRFNQASKRSHDHFGWKRVGKAAILKAWRLQVFTANTSPYVRISLSDAGRPTIELSAQALLAGPPAAEAEAEGEGAASRGGPLS